MFWFVQGVYYVLLFAIAERLRCPVTMTLNAKGLIDERDPLSLGHARSVRARAVQPHVDVMLVVRLAERRQITAPKALHEIWLTRLHGEPR